MINRQLIIQEARQLVLEDGAWDKSTRSLIAKQKAELDTMAHNRRENTGNYLFNPFVKGPVREGLGHITHAITKGVYDMVRDDDSPSSDKIKSYAKVNKNIKGQAWNKDMDTEIAANEARSKAIDKMKKEHPIQYYLNPFVSGPLNHFYVNRKAENAKTARQILSPTTAAGETLEKSK